MNSSGGSMAIRDFGPGRFQLDYYVNGKRIREVIRGTRRDAKDRDARIRSEILDGKYHRVGRRERITFEEAIAEYKVEKADKRSMRRDNISFKNLLRFFNGYRYLDQFSQKDIEAYRKERRLQVSGATVNREMALLKCLFNVAIRNNHLLQNPVRNVKFFPESARRGDRVLSGLEIKMLFAAAAPHLLFILLVAFFTGLRKGDILNLQWKDVDFRKHVIRIMMMKTGDPVEIPIHALLEPILRNAFDAAGPGASFVFISFRPKKDGTYSHFGDIKNAFRGALKRSGLADKGYCFHDLRRTFASMMYAKGVPLLTISKLLGHRSVKTTERYLNVKLEEKRQAVDILGDALDLNPDCLLPTVNIRSKEIEAAPAIAVLPSGLSPATVWRAEQPGGGGISDQTKLRIAQCLGVSPAEIFDQPDSRQSR